MPLDDVAVAPIRAAGIMLQCGKNVLFIKRGPGSDYPGMWAFPGGRLEAGETAEEAAERETREEIGPVAYGKLALHCRSIQQQESASTAPSPGPNGNTVPPGMDIPALTGNLPPIDAIAIPGPAAIVDFTTFRAEARDEFLPKLNDEHVAFAWAPADQPPEPLHPGARLALERLTMDELGIARAMAAGQLASPQQYKNLWLFAIRITGTGLAYRPAHKEYVWRDASFYINEDFLARCNGLPVIWKHPKKATLDTQEFIDRIIGTVMLPYILPTASAADPEVWGIAKILDMDAAAALQSKQYSTSPAVVVGGPDDRMLKTADGTPFLLEGKPVLLDHIAVVQVGVWDKGGEPAGVQIDNIQEIEAMATERADDATDNKAILAALGDVMSMLQAGTGRMDDLAARMDRADKARADAAEEDKEEKRKADKARRDGEREAWMKEDSAMCAKDDAAEDEARERFKKDGADEDEAAEKARKDRKDAWQARKDAAKKDEDDKKEKEEKEKADASRADSVEKQINEAVARAMAGLKPADISAKDRDELAAAQSRADAVYSLFGQRAQPPMVGELPRDYRLRMLKGMQAHSGDWKEVNLGTLDATALPVAEKRIYADAAMASERPSDLGEHELREVQAIDPGTGHRVTTFKGNHHFITQMGMRRPNRRLTGKGFRVNNQVN